MTPGAAEKCSAHPSLLQAQYETLRMAAVGEALPPQARSGLMLLVHRGMWGWARRVAAASAPHKPIHASSPSPTAPCDRETVIHVLAQMAMNSHERRAP